MNQTILEGKNRQHVPTSPCLDLPKSAFISFRTQPPFSCSTWLAKRCGDPSASSSSGSQDPVPFWGDLQGQ